MDHVALGATPYAEDCVQVNAGGDYHAAMKEECSRYCEFLKQRFPYAAQLFTLKRFSHDFGSYYEVCINYDEHDERQTSMAFFIEENLPATWDDAGTVPYLPTEEDTEHPAYP